MRRVSILLFVGLACGPAAFAQNYNLMPEPPTGVLWTMEPDGDAIQNDLGFIVPRKWKEFERQGFTSTRADGGSVKAYYLNGDQELALTMWIQLRADIRGIPLDADAIWSLMQIGINGEFGMVKPDQITRISEEKFSLGGRTPEGRMQWQRVALEKGPQVQGAWWQNMGVWSVIITLSGPEARREELEAAARTLFAELPFPSAPITTELSVNGDELIAGMPKCGKLPEGAGKEFVPTFRQMAMYGLLVPGTQLGLQNRLVISPVTHAKDYCVVETFSPRKDLPVTALQYRGPPSETWEARFAFVMNGGRGGVYQLERFVPDIADKAVDETRLDQVYLHYTNNKRASLYAVYDGWPDYKEFRKAFEKFLKDRPEPIISSTQTAEKLHIQTNTARILPVEGEKQ